MTDQRTTRGEDGYVPTRWHYLITLFVFDVVFLANLRLYKYLVFPEHFRDFFQNFAGRHTKVSTEVNDVSLVYISQ